MAVVCQCHPEIKLNQEQAELVQEKLTVVVDATDVEGTLLQFLNSKFIHPMDNLCK